MKTRQDYYMTDYIGCCDRSDQVPFVMKTRQDNDVIDRKGAKYVENDNELLLSIKSSDDYDENQIG